MIGHSIFSGHELVTPVLLTLPSELFTLGDDFASLENVLRLYLFLGFT